MKKHMSGFHYSWLAALAVSAMPAHAAGIRVGNLSRSYADAYNQVNNTRAQSAVVPTPQMGTVAAAPANADAGTGTGGAAETQTVELPIRVANANLAAMISRGDPNSPVNIDTLHQCAMVYPDGEFEWATPMLGRGAGGASTCVAVVELRAIGAGTGGADAVLARANLAAGDRVRCNISDFPESSYLAAAGDFVFPADNEPTVDDVVQVMNDEQKKNAGIKIAAGALAAGVAGNMLGNADAGSSKMFGTNKAKMKTTAIGGLTGAAIMAGNAYAGKVGGDMILSTGVNAAAGGLVGNMMASGDSVLRIEECKLPNGTTSSCLWGMLVSGEPFNGNAYFNIDDRATIMLCDQDNKNCKSEDLISVKLKAYPDTFVSDITDASYEKILSSTTGDLMFHLDGGEMVSGAAGSGGRYTPILSALKKGRQTPAMISGIGDKAMGIKKKDWTNMRRGIDVSRIYGRASNGSGFILTDMQYTVNDFYPMMVSADDGGLIDLDNKARLKGTLTGAGVGGALGAFTAYQGAQQDIDDGWVTAVREYKDSLQKVYCATGTRFLGFYNSDIDVSPLME